MCDSYAASVGAAHFQTSAKTNRGLDEVFNHLASSKSSSESVAVVQCIRPSCYLHSPGGCAIEMLEKKPVAGKGPGGGAPKQKLVIVDEPVQAQKKSGCC